MWFTQGIDKTLYSDKVAFEDPITKYDSVDGYLLNIQMLRYLFSPVFVLHKIDQVRTKRRGLTPAPHTSFSLALALRARVLALQSVSRTA